VSKIVRRLIASKVTNRMMKTGCRNTKLQQEIELFSTRGNLVSFSNQSLKIPENMICFPQYFGVNKIVRVHKE
jgi:hypothetical protein